MTTNGTNRRGLVDRPIVDWVIVAVIVVPLVLFTPLITLFVGTDADGQRGAMSSVSSLLANVAAFGVAALFAYSALENPITRRMRARWGPHLTWVFLRSLGIMFIAAAVTGMTAVSVPSKVGTVVFLTATLVGSVKLLRLLLVVAALLKGQDMDAQRDARAAPEVRGAPPGRGGQSA
jgi:small-conductance mechanosensitive channel